MSTTYVYGAKGGVGTSTVAVAIALQLAQAGQQVSLLAPGRGGDVYAILGVHDNASDAHGVRLGYDQSDTYVIDAGTDVPEADHPYERVIEVVDNTYLAIRRLAATRPLDDTIVVVVEHEGRSLTAKDVELILGRPVVIVPGNAAIARAIDAGLFPHRTVRQQLVKLPA